MTGAAPLSILPHKAVLNGGSSFLFARYKQIPFRLIKNLAKGQNLCYTSLAKTKEK